MIDWSDAYNAGDILTLDDKTGFMFGTMDPSSTEPGINIPASAIFIRTSPPEIWQKQSEDDLDWEKLGDNSIVQVPQLSLPFLLSDGNQIQLPLDTNMVLPFLMADGSMTNLELEV